MVKFLTLNSEYNHNWNAVTLALWKKYPNPFAAHVLAVDVIDRHIDENGIIHTTRLFLKKGKMPAWGAKLLNISEAYILETSTVDPKRKEMTVKTKNLSHKKILLVEECQTIRPTLNNNTDISTEVRIISNTSFFSLRSRIEGWGLNRFKQGALNSSKGLAHVLEQLKLEFKQEFNPVHA
ncbi:PRELI-like family-domain-containing protein [Globomyces pollinis-pini]|nr:PRELI-like family-domain-containing protein [Globomyces pollinis-pini]